MNVNLSDNLPDRCRGLARLCGVKHNSWKKGGSQYTHVIDEYLAQSGLVVVANTTPSLVPDVEAAEVIGYYAEEQQNPTAKASSRPIPLRHTL